MYAISDLYRAFLNLRGWSYLARKRLQIEYRRTWIGSAWILVTFTLTSFGIGALMAQLQGHSLAEHIPYVMFGFAGFNFISGAITGGANAMLLAKPFLLQMPTPRSAFTLSLVLKNFYLFGLQLIAAALVSSLLGWRPSLMAFWMLPALATYVFTAFWVTTALGLVCARIRDVGRLLESGMRLAFFFTPIIWLPESSRGHQDGLIGAIMQWNPISYALLAFRDGLLGYPPTLINWIVLLSIACGFSVIGFIALNVFGRRLTYWL